MKQRHVTVRTSSRLSMRAISSPTVSPNGSATRPHSRIIPCPKILNRTGKIDIEGYLPARRASPGRVGAKRKAKCLRDNLNQDILLMSQDVIPDWATPEIGSKFASACQKS